MTDRAGVTAGQLRRNALTDVRPDPKRLGSSQLVATSRGRQATQQDASAYRSSLAPSQRRSASTTRTSISSRSGCDKPTAGLPSSVRRSPSQQSRQHSELGTSGRLADSRTIHSPASARTTSSAHSTVMAQRDSYTSRHACTPQRSGSSGGAALELDSVAARQRSAALLQRQASSASSRLAAAGSSSATSACHGEAALDVYAQDHTALRPGRSSVLPGLTAADGRERLRPSPSLQSSSAATSGLATMSSDMSCDSSCSHGPEAICTSPGAGASARSPRFCRGWQAAVGLQNLGNTCFMNSMLQCLNCVPAVTRFALQTEAMLRRSAVVAPAYIDLLREMSGMSQHDCARPSQFLRKISSHDSRWAGGRQHDSHEFLISLLEVLQKECDQNVQKPQYRELSGRGPESQQAAEALQYAQSWNNSWVDEAFGGLLQSTIQCQKCRHESHCFDAFLDLSVPIKSRSACTVQDCLSAFTEHELLDAGYTCELCKACSPAVKRLQVYQPPKTLIVHIKRFSQQHRTGSGLSMLGSGRLSRNAAEVYIPATLDLRQYCNPEGLCRCGLSGMYELIAVSDHSGSLAGGHYTARGRAPSDGRWYSFNDSHVSPAAHPAAPSSTAYVLFYQIMDAS